MLIQATRENGPPRWKKEIDVIDSAVKKIQKKSNVLICISNPRNKNMLFLAAKELQALHSKRLMVNFENDEETQEIEIEQKTAEITALFREADGGLKRINYTDSAVAESNEELKIKANIQHGIAKKLQGLNTSFRTIQKVYTATLILVDTIGVAVCLLSCHSCTMSWVLNLMLSYQDYLNRLRVQKAETEPLDFKAAKAAPRGVEAAFEDEGFTKQQQEMVDDMEEVWLYNVYLIQPSV